jgi:hypothetical protein
MCVVNSNQYLLRMRLSIKGRVPFVVGGVAMDLDLVYSCVL